MRNIKSAIGALCLLASATVVTAQKKYDLGYPDSKNVPFFATAIGNGERNVVFDALRTFAIDAASIFFEPIAFPQPSSQQIKVNIWEVVPDPANQRWPFRRGTLLKSATAALFNRGERFYDVPISFVFEKGKRYALGFESVYPWPWGEYLNRMRFWSFGPGKPNYKPFGVDGAAKVLAGGFNGDYKNDQIPHIGLDEAENALTDEGAKAPKYTVIPALVNIYRDKFGNESVLKPAVAQWLKEMNEAAKKHKFQVDCPWDKIVVVQGGGDANENAKVDDEPDETNIRNSSIKELTQAYGAGKGYKWNFFTDPNWRLRQDGTESNASFSYHAPSDDRGRVAFMRELKPKGNPGGEGSTSQSMGHELLHSMTLGPSHKIDSANGVQAGEKTGHPPTEAKPGADGFYHTLPQWCPNWMAPQPDRTGTDLTAEQKAEIETHFANFGDEKVVKSPPQTILREKGAQSDPSGDSAPGKDYLDLIGTALSSEAGSPLVDLSVSLNGTFEGAVNAAYSIGIDADNNNLTGGTYDGSPGLEFAIELTVVGTAGNYSITGMVRRLSDNATRPLLPVPQVNPVDLLHDAQLPGEHVADQIAVALQKSLVGLDTTAATMIPFHIAAKLAGAVVDRADVVFNMRYWETVPDLNITGSCVPQPGQPFGFGLVRMPVNAAFDVFVNDSQVSTGVTDGTGNYTGSFIFPALPITETHFVKSRTQATGAMAFSVTCTSP